jgi:hypothetical protein
MKNPDKLRLFFFTVVIMAFGGYYLVQNNCQPFQNTFLEKEIVFPMTVKAVAKKYNLLYDSIAIRGMPSNKRDTLLIVDSKDNSSDAYAMVFYLRGISTKEMGILKNQLEEKYGTTFEMNRIPSSFQYMKIHDCVYVLVDTNKYGINEVFKGTSSDTITYRVGFYYGLSKSELISTSADGHSGIIGKGYEPLAY